MSDEHKAKGNAAFQQGSFQEAITHFSAGVEVDPSNHVLYSNRSACYASLKQFDKALEDAQKVVELKPDWPKGYSRLGAAYHGLEDFTEALESYDKGLKIDPENATLKSGKESAQQAERQKNKAAGGGLNKMFQDPNFLARLAMNPETKSFMGDPTFLKMLQDVQSNPQMMQFYMNDPRFQKALGVGLGINFSTPGESAGNGGEQEFEAVPEAENQPENKPTVVEEETASKPEAKATQETNGTTPMEEEKSGESSSKAAALKEKDLGNAAYKQKDFETAIKHYDKAMELYEDDISFLTNRAAVYFEMANYDKCIQDCDLAVEKGRELRSDYKLIAKAMTRKGNALVKLEKLDEAVTIYKKSLTEHRNPDTLKRLQDTEKFLKTKIEQDYVNIEMAEEENQKGNGLFKDMKYPEAVQHYTEALKRGPPGEWENAYKTFSNRAACYTKLGALNEGLKDAEECIRLKPEFPKGYSRKGHIQFFSKEYEKALETYDQGLLHDPSNQELLDGKRRCQEKLSEFLSGNVSEQELKERQEKAMQDPEVQSILQDPVMQQVLKDFQENPKSAQNHLKEPSIMTKLTKLMSAGIIQMK
eukprot:TRINITY_DN10134_c0_g1_i1.p1 TRINITY_DN10134_c0_g1~~TRINITY_DN10134_c0_g1_i1.p1  ORF type:complete len:617 (+),score=132.73 TRINITY_DN10134_c0_g1_i1:86-1852(+)